MTISSIADIAGDNAAHQLAGSGRARRIFLTSLTGASRFGDANVSSSRGVSLPAGVPVVISVSDADLGDGFDLSKCYAYVATGATLTISYGT